jgi:hypothetical protein
LFFPAAPIMTEEPTADLDADPTAWHAPMLRELAELSLEMARVLLARARDGEGSGEGRGDPGLALARVTRSARLTMALNSRMADERAARLKAAETERVERRKKEKRERGEARRRQISDVIWREAQKDRSDEEAREVMEALDERLNDLEDWDVDFLERPIEALLDQVRAELGLVAVAVGDGVAAPSPSPSRGGVGVGAPAPSAEPIPADAEERDPGERRADTPTPCPLPARGRGFDEPPWVGWAVERPSG